MEKLILSNICKTYPGVKALDDVTMSFKEGEVHAIVGENGAGKSTFIKTISGAIQPDSGAIVLDGQEILSMNPKLAIEKGIAVVYQELVQLDALTVADNIYMGMKFHGNKIRLDDKVLHEKTKKLLTQFNCSAKSTDLIRDLSIANRQIIEIAKAVVKNASIIIMDEPTAAITVEEQQYLFKNIRQLKKEGVTVIYISHRMDELFEICDRVSVLRDGKYIKTVNIEDTNRDELIQLMVGRDLKETYPIKQPPENEVMLKVENLSGNGVKDISFELHKGEILGFGGLVGAGRTELMHLIYGAAQKTTGKMYIKGDLVEMKTTSDGVKSGIGIIPEDRKWQGCFVDKPIFWNISISNLKQLCRGLIVDEKKDMKQAEKYMDAMRIKTPSLKQAVINLSGGNQQKVVIAKVLAGDPDILIFDEPTRGIDVGARFELYTIMIDLTKKGKSIIMVSSDMEELLGMSDRIIVLHEGRQMGCITQEAFSQERVLAYASGV